MTMEFSSAPSPTDKFMVSPWMDVVGRLLFERPKLMQSLAKFETKLFEDRFDDIPVTSPVWVSGLARSGSTVLLELLAEHPQVATQRYRDFPPLFTPILWNKLVDYMPFKDDKPAERAHKDGIYVTSESPEAFEEPIWMNFFPHLHKRVWDETFSGDDGHPEFEEFLRAHIRKLLFVRDGQRYLAKANYNTTRLEYLLKMFPDARFVVPVRGPIWHIASLMKQHKLFVQGEVNHPEARAHLARAGHFEFGLDRMPINCGNESAAAEIAGLWAEGKEAEGWALQWAEVYGYLAERFEANPALAEAALVVRYEDLCEKPDLVMQQIIEHCRLDASPDIVERARLRLHPPEYYRPEFSPEELHAIRGRTANVAHYFGYKAAS
ncbi:conserved hypothetical protein [Parvibaculum lavamentivorans DS-1]|uniref:Sulfotransferase n=1 Tax=Parvibaculum lavamentivorans (strain DS-1 / DSM 13023 / NCIMB 13966) TaxID=402881 RepID=A7HTP2_PARL1|nr:sulfotransferase [Parvibaculum lavamentivorans]ABS63275.1 conserved hypothetical protein [Parvibaculum lavamentivorans DS-1]